MTTDIAALNGKFGIDGQIAFKAGPGDLVSVEITNAYARAAVALQGGHVYQFQPHGAPPVLWLSRLSRYTPGKAIRGGIPICWPWFGPHPDDQRKPAHGFARTLPWTVLSTAVDAGGAIQLQLGLQDTPETRALWPHAFDLRLTIVVGATLQIALRTRNTDTATWTYTGALHSYFQVSDVTTVAIDGLDQTTYVDKVDAGQRKLQHGPVTIDGEIDRVYLATAAATTLRDPGGQRRIMIAKSGSRSTVVWNPWQAKAQQLADFGDEEFRTMLCVETANAADDVITLQPGAEHVLGAHIAVARGEHGS